MFIKRRRIYWGILILCATVMYFAFNPAIYSFFPSCPFYKITGWECPGCGSQRAIHELLHLNFLEAIKHNLLLVFSVPYIVLVILFNFMGLNQKLPFIQKILFGKISVIIIVLIILVYSIGRNIH